jgi:Putative transposase
MTLATDEFIRRFLIHVLPKRFHRIRHYGLLAKTQPRSRSIRSCWAMGTTISAEPAPKPTAISPAARPRRSGNHLSALPTDAPKMTPAIYLSVDRSRKPPRGHGHFGGAFGQLALRERNATGLGQRDRHLSHRFRLSYIPLAHPIAVCSLCQVDVNVIGMIGV